VRIVSGEPLYPLLALAGAAVVLASTVGLEALMFGVPLGVLEIPGAGWVHDYVAAGAGVALSVGERLEEQVGKLMSTWRESSSAAVQAYLAHHLAERRDATTRVVEVIRKLVDGR
jgi:hypothetical protein